ncbi:hypothetical protein [Brevibacillus sp. Leaf182]|nr:hypothetical protein [Brevibacillus sp. Leaf182]
MMVREKPPGTGGFFVANEAWLVTTVSFIQQLCAEKETPCYM